METLISIALPVYNGERFLKEQLESILKQDHKALEVVAVDDSSSDKTFELLLQYSKQDSRVKAYRNRENLGLGPNFLKALSYCRGDLIAFSDQDDFWEPDKLRVLKKTLENDASNMMAYSDLEVCDEMLRPMGSFWGLAAIKPWAGRWNEAILLRNRIPGCSMLFRRQVRDKMLAVEEPLLFVHDHLAFLIASLSGGVVYSRRRLVRYRQHNDNTIGVFKEERFNKEIYFKRLKKQINCVSNFSKTAEPSLKRLLMFAKVAERGSALERLRYLKYFLTLRKDMCSDKLLGVLECISPRFYQWLRAKKDRYKINLWN